jgi:uncharacterized protein YjbI with pentapeptide repeats
LQHAELSGANLHAADLRAADLQEAVLSRADLSETYLSGTNLSRAILWHANFCNAYLLNVDLRLAECMETFFVNVMLSGVQGLESMHHVTNSTLDHRTLARNPDLPVKFLRACGLPDFLIENRAAFTKNSG